MTTPSDNGWGQPSPDSGYGQPLFGKNGEPLYGQPQYGQQGQQGQPPYGQPGQTPYEQPNAPGYGEPQYGQPRYGHNQYGPPHGTPGFQNFTPAAKPGIIPLRPLRLGEFLDGAFGAIRSNPRVMIGLTAVIVAVTVALATTLIAVGATQVAKHFGSDDVAESMAFIQIQASPYAVGLLMSFVLPLMTGMLIVSVSRSVIGEKTPIATVWALAWRKLGPLLALSFLIFAGVIVALGAYVAALIALVQREANVAIVVVFAIVGGLGLLVFYAWVLVRTLLIAPVLVLEDATFGAAIKRGWALSRGSFWRLLGIYVLTQIIVSIVSSIIVFPISVIAGIAMMGSPTQTFWSVGIFALGNVVTYTVTTAFSSSVVALLYVDVRMRREGLDVELTAAAARSQGN